MEKLKPCPFCGGKGYLRTRRIRTVAYREMGSIRRNYMSYYIQCGRCRSRGGCFTAQVWMRGGGRIMEDADREMLTDGAIKNWNNREEG